MMRFKRFFSRWTNWVGLFLVLIYVGTAIAAPYLSPQNPKEPGMFLRVGRKMEPRPMPPNEKAILGMLPFGYDVYHSLIWGSRDALQFGLAVTLTTAIFGMLYGAIAGMSSNLVSTIMLRIADAFLAFPPIAGLVFLQQLLVTSLASLGQMVVAFSPFVTRIENPVAIPPIIQFMLQNINPLMVSLILFSWMPYARLVNAMVLTLKQTDFVQAARALGASPFWIIRKHLIQNATGPAMVLAARDVGGVVLFQATLTFIGLGGNSVWGSMLAQGRDWVIGPGGSLLKYWWVFLPPTIAVMIFGIAWNVLGDGLRDVFEETSQPGYYGPSFLGRLFGKRKRQQMPEEASVFPATTPNATSQSLLTSHSPNGSHSILLTARDYAARGELTNALHSYQHLIQRGKLISEVVPDLASLVKQYPHDPQMWQTLGDALNRSGDVAHAAQSYERARKLKQ